MTWIYKDSTFTPDDIKDYVGFIYEITETNTNKRYIGQKVFFNKIIRPPLKGKKRRRRCKILSNWQKYYGSNEILQKLVALNGEMMYNRKILRLCKSKAEMNYYETKTIFDRDAVINEEYFNNWVSCKINHNQVKKLSPLK